MRDLRKNIGKKCAIAFAKKGKKCVMHMPDKLRKSAWAKTSLGVICVIYFWVQSFIAILLDIAEYIYFLLGIRSNKLDNVIFLGNYIKFPTKLC